MFIAMTDTLSSRQRSSLSRDGFAGCIEGETASQASGQTRSVQRYNIGGRSINQSINQSINNSFLRVAKETTQKGHPRRTDSTRNLIWSNAVECRTSERSKRGRKSRSFPDFGNTGRISGMSAAVREGISRGQERLTHLPNLS